MRTVIQLQNRQDELPSVEKDHYYFSGPFSNPGSVPNLPPSTTLLGRFVIQECIANVRGIAVYTAQDLMRDADVTLKIVDGGPLSEKWNTSHLRREIRFNRMVSEFEHIIKIFDIHQVPFGGTSLLFLSMEYADGGSLREWLIKHRDNPDLRRSLGLQYALQVCRGLCHLHDTGIIHLDLKPENMLFLDGRLKISDLGSAIFAGISKESRKSGRGICAQDRCTPYMSPEQIRQRPTRFSPRSDIYSLGVILYELFDSKCCAPFQGPADSLRELHLNEAPPPLRDVPERLTDVVHRCLNKDAGHRYESVKDLVTDLKNSSSNGTVKESVKLDGTLEKAQTLYSQENLRGASELLEEMISVEPGNEAAKELLAKIRKRFNQAEIYYRMCMEEMEQSDLDTLMEHIKRAVAIYRDHPAGILAQAKFEARAKRLTASLEKGAEALKKGLWEEAFHWLKAARELDPGNDQIRPTCMILERIVKIRRDIDQALVENDFKKARRLARIADMVIEDMKRSVPLLRERYPGLDNCST